MRTEYLIRLLSIVLVFALSTFLFVQVAFGVEDCSADVYPLIVSPDGSGSGDVNGDGVVDISDARAVLLHALGSEKLVSEARKAADVDRDGAVTVADAQLVLQKAEKTTGVGLYDPDGVRGVWVSTVSGDFPSRTDLTADQLKEEITQIVRDVKALGLDTLYVQTRSHSDAIYPSKIFPSSRYIVGREGAELPLDVLQCFTETAHAYGLRIHAWINPYRVTSSSHDLRALSADNPAVKYPERIVYHYDKSGKPAGVWYDPGLPEVREMIVAGVAEIVKNYDVDGIHFDDYFYPYENALNFEDADSYRTYGAGLSLDDWRRKNVNDLIFDVYTAVKSFKPAAAFGISPFGVWAKKSDKTPQGTEGLGNVLESYSDIYADTVTWVKNGWLDYVCPQLYWQMEGTSAPFETLASWWKDLCRDTSVDLYIGMAAYRGDEFGEKELTCQMMTLEDLTKPDGVVFFSYGSLKNDLGAIRETLSDLYGQTKEVFDGTVTPREIGPAYIADVSRVDLMTKTKIVDGKYDPTDFHLGVTGMKVSVAEKVNDVYSRLTNGMYIKTESLKPCDRTLRQTVLGKMTFMTTDRYTYFYIPTTEKAACAFLMASDKTTFTLFDVANTATMDAFPKNNPLFSDVAVTQDGTTVTVTATLKQKEHTFGYLARYVDDVLVIRFNNPTPARSGPKPLDGYVISLDPGHSNTLGSTTTYNNTRYDEYILNYELSLRVREKLEKLGARVVLTHENERKKGLDTLIEEVRRTDSVLNVSIHFNWIQSTTAKGTATWWCYDNSRLLAECLQNSFCETTGLNNRGVSHGYYKVSRFCEFPSVLFETLYTSTPEEFEWYITSKKNQDSVAEGIANGILAFFQAQ